MTAGRALGLSIAGVMVLFGVLFTGQGLGWIGGSAMTGVAIWAVIGPILAGLGVALVITIIGNARRNRGGDDLAGRYGAGR